ncbi:MAG: TIGR01777 family oxidoreductase [Anaerolineae bacterium]|nr:TIGR01777 family oxidoreductase [Anaerolineae bacterium]
MHIIIAGGSGLIGRALIQSLTADGHTVTVLSRSPGNVIDLPDGAEAVYWDGKTANDWGDAVNTTDAIVDLAGASIGGQSLLSTRWTSARRRRMVDSRLNAGKAILEAIDAATHKPGVLLQASAIGYYGTHEDDRQLTEAASPGHDFLANLCVQWEQGTKPVERMGVRRVIARTGLVLSTRGGALPRQMLPFKFFAGGPMGSGEQWYSWIHLHDEIRAMRFLLENGDAKGAFNLTAPNPVTNAQFSEALGAAMNRPSWLTVPALALKLGLGEAAMMVLEGQRVVPERLQAAGFMFDFSEVGPALLDVVRNRW